MYVDKDVPIELYTQPHEVRKFAWVSVDYTHNHSFLPLSHLAPSPKHGKLIPSVKISTNVRTQPNSVGYPRTPGYQCGLHSHRRRSATHHRLPVWSSVTQVGLAYHSILLQYCNIVLLQLSHADTSRMAILSQLQYTVQYYCTQSFTLSLHF